LAPKVRTSAVTLPAVGAGIEEPGVKEQVSFVPMLSPSHPQVISNCNAPERRFSATLGEEPEIELALV
jgi:hypothetical protein